MQRLKIVFLLAFACATTTIHAQIRKPAKWTFEVSSTSVKSGDEVELIFKANIDDGWYMYSNDFSEECGPILASLELIETKDFKKVGELKAIGSSEKYEEVFECSVRVFKHTAEFRQRIKVLSGPLEVTATISGQTCQSAGDRVCVNFAEDMIFEKINVSGSAGATPVKKNNDEQLSNNPEQQIPVQADPKDSLQSIKTSANYGDVQGPIMDPQLIKDDPSKNSFLGFFIVAFLAGLAALLTPCVFPMIPMTVTFFTGPGKTKAHALIYGASIVIIYVLVGIAVAPLMGPETANHLSTEWLPNLIFFTVFIVFGLSFLGLFDITLPGTFINKMDQQAEKGGLVGVFFMAFTLVLVSFSCTGPLVGSILVSSAGGEFLKPIVGMLGFSLAFAIPFTVFAFFPSLMNSLPKSGGWLNAVKVVLGLVEIGFAFKFLSIADQAFHWGILDRDINIAIWVVIVALIGIYLMKGFRLPGDTGKDIEDKRIGIPRFALAIVSFTFLIYLIPGLWGAPLKALAGYLPPLYTHDFNLLKAQQSNTEICEEPKYADFLHLPHGLNGYFDYKQALACARQQNKPLFIDFTGHGCTNCREMEAVVWSDPLVLAKLQKDFVVVALYVDDKTELPEADWYTSTYDNKVKKTIGKQNADLQIRRLNNNAQPYYCLVGKDEKVLVTPYEFERDPKQFAEFLDRGIKKFRETSGKN
jgi:thiol:disulfide interchange protein